MGERTRIARYFAPLAAAEAGSFNLTDDTAVLMPPPGQQLVITTDSVIENIHVMPGATPQQFAQKLVRRNVSDLAAMGASPWRYTLNLHTPARLTDDWFTEFAAALAREQQQFGMVLIGGDSTTGSHTIHSTLTCFGLLEGSPLRRNGATIGDDLYVSGSVGGAAYALSLLRQHLPISDALAAYYHCPEPRLALGSMLRGVATSVIDISDGLLADILQVCTASQCATIIERDVIPLPTELKQAVEKDSHAWRFAVSGGDDYELCFTVAPAQRASVQALAQILNLPLTRIGRITQGEGMTLVDTNSNELPIARTGYEHA